MPRVARVVIPGLPHHVTQPGNNRQDPSEEDLSALRLSAKRGRPVGSDTFLSKLEAMLNRRLRPLPVGRPSREANPAAPTG